MPGIRWRKSDKEELFRAVKNFNAKIARQTKKGKGIYQPERFTLSQAKGMIKSRADYNEVMQYLRGYIQRGAEAPVQVKKNVLLTKFEVEQIKRAEQRINKQRKAIRKKFVRQVGIYGGALLKELELKDIRLRPEVTPTQRIPTLLKLVRTSLAGYTDRLLELRKQNLLLAAQRVFGGTFTRLEDYISTSKASDIYGPKWEPLMSQEYFYSADSLELKRQMINDYLDKLGV